MGLHNGVGDESCRNLLSTEPSSIKPLDSLLGSLNGTEFHIDFTLTTIETKFDEVGL